MTEYQEFPPETLVTVGLAQLAEAQDAHRVATLGGDMRINDPDAPRTISGGAARVHADFLVASALAHFAAALAMPVDYNDELDEEDDGGDDTDGKAT